MFFERVPLLVGHLAQEIAFDRQRLDGVPVIHCARHLVTLLIRETFPEADLRAVKKDAQVASIDVQLAADLVLVALLEKQPAQQLPILFRQPVERRLHHHRCSPASIATRPPGLRLSASSY